MKQKNHNNQVDYFNLSFGKRLVFELYDVEYAPCQLNNLAAYDLYPDTLNSLIEERKNRLRTIFDPRITGIGIEHFKNDPYFGNKDIETGWVTTAIWENLSKEQKQELLREKLSHLEKNK